MKKLAWISALKRLRSWSYHFMANRRGKSGSNDRLFFLGSKITEVGDCSHDIQRRLLLGRKAMTNLNTILKAEISLCRQRTQKAMDFPVLMYRHESWIIKESWVLKNWCFQTGVGDDSWESLGLQGDPTSPSKRRSVLYILWKDWCWSWNSNTLAIWCEELTHWKRPWCWERLRAGGEGDDRGWDGWIASPTQWTWVRANSKRQWRTEESGVLWVHGAAKIWTRLSNWIITRIFQELTHTSD